MAASERMLVIKTFLNGSFSIRSRSSPSLVSYRKAPRRTEIFLGLHLQVHSVTFIFLKKIKNFNKIFISDHIWRGATWEPKKWYIRTQRSSHQSCSIKTGCSKKITIFTENTCVGEFLFNKVAGLKVYLKTYIWKTEKINVYFRPNKTSCFRKSGWREKSSFERPQMYFLINFP